MQSFISLIITPTYINKLPLKLIKTLHVASWVLVATRSVIFTCPGKRFRDCSSFGVYGVAGMEYLLLWDLQGVGCLYRFYPALYCFNKSLMDVMALKLQFSPFAEKKGLKQKGLRTNYKGRNL